MAKRYECALRVSHLCDSGNGAPKRKKCPYCGGSFNVSEGSWGVFVWRGDGRYPSADAVKVCERESAAQHFADADTDGALVVRWIAA